MATDKKRDAQIQKLIDIVQVKRDEIKKAERPNWKTNCSFGFDENKSNRINLQVVSDTKVLSKILGFLYSISSSHDKANKALGLEDPFIWLGYPLIDWEEDLKTRVNKIQITKKKKDLDVWEGKLDKLISPERRAQMELDAIEKELLGQ